MKKRDPWSIFWRNALPQYGVVFAQYVVPVLTLPYLTRVLGPSVYGQIVLLTAATSYFQLVVEFGMNLSAAKLVVTNSKDAVSLRTIQRSVNCIRAALSILSLFAFTLVLILTNFAQGFELLAVAYFASGLLAAYVPIYMFRGLERMRELSGILVLSRVAYAVLIFLFVRSETDVVWVPVAFCASSILVLLYAARSTRVIVGPAADSFDFKHVSNLARVSTSYFIDAVASTAFGALTIIFISFQGFSLAQVAEWGAAYTLISVSQSLFMPVMSSLLPRMSDDPDWPLLKKLLIVLFPVVFLGCGVILLAGDSIVLLLYGPAFQGAGLILRALTPVLLISFPAILLGAPLLGAIGKERSIGSSTVVSGVFFLAGLLVMSVIGSASLLAIAFLRGIAEAVLLAVRFSVLIRHRRVGGAQ